MPIFKAAENKRCGGKGGFKVSPKATIAYITRPDKAFKVTSLALDDTMDYTKQFKSTADLWNKAQTANSRKYYHFIHSFSICDNITPEQAHEITEELCRHSFPQSEVIIATHNDREHIHCHIVLNAVNYDNGRMLQISPQKYTRIKDLSNELAEAHGFSTVDFRKPSKKQKRISQGEHQIMLRGGISWKDELREVIELACKETDSMMNFEQFLNKYGVMLTRNTEKTISYKHPKKSKAIRGEKLGQDYTKEGILRELDEHSVRPDFKRRDRTENIESDRSDYRKGQPDIGTEFTGSTAFSIGIEIEQRSRAESRKIYEQRSKRSRECSPYQEAERRENSTSNNSDRDDCYSR